MSYDALHSARVVTTIDGCEMGGNQDEGLVEMSQNFIARSAGELNHACRMLSASPVLGCDTETAGFSARTCRLLSVQISNGEFSVLVPASEGVMLGPLASLLASPEHLKVIHNAKFDLRFLNEAGYAVSHIFDSMVAEKLITKGADQSSSLAETLYRYFAVDLDKSARQIFSSKRWDGRWHPELVAYALRDVVYLPELQRQQAAWLERLGLHTDFAGKMTRLVSNTRHAESRTDNDDEERGAARLHE